MDSGAFSPFQVLSKLLFAELLGAQPEITKPSQELATNKALRDLTERCSNKNKNFLN